VAGDNPQDPDSRIFYHFFHISLIYQPRCEKYYSLNVAKGAEISAAKHKRGRKNCVVPGTFDRFIKKGRTLV
jgi:hypothetical protein